MRLSARSRDPGVDAALSESPLGVWPPRAPPPNMEPEDPPDEGVAAAPDDPV